MQSPSIFCWWSMSPQFQNARRWLAINGLNLRLTFSPPLYINICAYHQKSTSYPRQTIDIRPTSPRLWRINTFHYPRFIIWWSNIYYFAASAVVMIQLQSHLPPIPRWQAPQNSGLEDLTCPRGPPKQCFTHSSISAPKLSMSHSRQQVVPMNIETLRNNPLEVQVEVRCCQDPAGERNDNPAQSILLRM